MVFHPASHGLHTRKYCISEKKVVIRKLNRCIQLLKRQDLLLSSRILLMPIILIFL